MRRYDSDGNQVWTKTFGHSPKDDAVAIAVDASGIYVAGSTSAAPANRLNLDVLVGRYDHDGQPVWERQFGRSGPDEPFGIAVDATGVYIVGAIGEGMAGFVAKYDLDGGPLWNHSFGDSVSGDSVYWMDYASGVAVDSTGVYVSGVMSQSSVWDAFLRRYDSDGNEIWTRQFGTVARDQANGVALNEDGVYVVGRTGGNLATGEASPYGEEGFVRSYDSQGSERWTRQLSWDVARAVAADASNVYLVGGDGAVATFDSFGTDQIQIDYGFSTRAFGVAVSDAGLFVVGDTNGPLLDGDHIGDFDAYLLKIYNGEQPVAGTRLHVACPGDINADGAADVAAVMLDGEVFVRGLNKTLVSRFRFDDLAGVADITLLADSNGNGSPELAALGTAEEVDRNVGTLAVLSQVNDLRTGQRVSVGTKSDGISWPIDIEALEDINGSGIQELAHLGRGGNKVKVKDAVSQKWLNTVPFINRFNPVDLEIFPDIDGDGIVDLGVLGDNKDAAKYDTLEVRSLLTGQPIWQLSMSKAWTVLKQELIADINDNGYPEVAILRSNFDTQGNQYVLFDTSPGMEQLAVVDLDTNFTPMQLLVIADVNGNGADELVVFGHHRHNTGQKALVIDSKTGMRIRNVYFDRNFTGQDINICADMNANGAAELVLLGERDSDGKLRAIVKDALSGAFIGRVDF